MSVVPTGLVRAAAVGAFAALVAATGGPAYAGDGYDGFSDGPSSGTITGTETTTQTTPGQSGSTGTGSSGTGYTGTGSSTGGSGASTSTGGTTVPNTCGSYQGSTFVPYECPADPADPAEPGQPPARPQVTTEMVTEAARVTAPVNPPHVEPGTVSFVNIPNNYWTESPTVNDSVTVLRQVIPVVWTPTGTTWNFGDGSSATGDGVEGADVGAPGAIEHSYARQGSYDITTATTYNLSFVLPGQGAQTIALTSPPSPPVTLPVREIQTLVDFTS
jgi:hypothetical protein